MHFIVAILQSGFKEEIVFPSKTMGSMTSLGSLTTTSASNVTSLCNYP
jgi:hypothetical protein